ncbi:MAG: RDD family protein [Bdellovibrio sp.]
MDPFEEFEFKPLTDGLGFHKKKASPSTATTAADPILKNQGLELIEEPGADPLRPPLPRKSRGTATIPSAPSDLTEVGGDGSAAVDAILKTLQKNRRLDFENSKQKISTPTAREEYKKSTWSFSAAFLDGMLVIASGLLCMIILLVVTKVDLVRNLSQPDEQGMIYLATLALFASVIFIYLTVNRLYLGCTPGEWAFDQRIGKPEEMNRTSYALRVVARSLLVLVTGVITLPLLSTIFGRDLVGNWTGTQLYKKA